mgnify:CR=1 FL=1
MKFRNWLKSALKVTKIRTGRAGETIPAPIPKAMAMMICGKSHSLIFFMRLGFCYKDSIIILNKRYTLPEEMITFVPEKNNGQN